MERPGWYIRSGETPEGPFDLAALGDLLNAGVVEAGTEVSFGPAGKRVPVSEALEGRGQPNEDSSPDAARGIGEGRWVEYEGEDLVRGRYWAKLGFAALVLMATVSVVSLFLGVEPDEPSWPDVFEEQHAGLPYPGPPRMTVSRAEEAAGAYGFAVAQSASLDWIGDNLPAYASNVELSKIRFEARFGASTRAIDSAMGENRDWLQTKAALQYRAMQTLLNQTIDPSAASEFIELVDQRSKGESGESPYIETLLSFVPAYRSRPEREYHDDFKAEFRTDGSGKSRGLSLGIEHPLSWKQEPGRRPHIVQNIVGGYGHSLDRLSILVREPEIVLDASDFEPGACQEAFPGGQLLDYGVAETAGFPSMWCEVRTSERRTGISMEMMSLTVFVLVDGQLAQFMFSVATSDTVGGDDLESRYRRHAPLFRLMWNSIEFFDRYQ